MSAEPQSTTAWAIEQIRLDERNRIIALFGEDMVVVPYGWCSPDHILGTEELRAFLTPKA